MHLIFGLYVLCQSGLSVANRVSTVDALAALTNGCPFRSWPFGEPLSPIGCRAQRPLHWQRPRRGGNKVSGRLRGHSAMLVELDRFICHGVASRPRAARGLQDQRSPLQSIMSLVFLLTGRNVRSAPITGKNSVHQSPQAAANSLDRARTWF
jgi:hypothetical protein